VTARDPRPPESSSPELIAEEANEDVLGLFAEAEASSTPSMSPLVPTVRADPQRAGVTPTPVATPEPVATPADSPAAKASTPPFAASAAKTLVSHSPERLPRSTRDQATQPPTSRASKKSSPRAAAARPPEPGVSGWGMVLVKGLLAFAVAFGFTSWVLIPVLSPAPAPPDTDSPSSMPSASPSSATTAPAAAPDADAER
jgi:hypothetical protein